MSGGGGRTRPRHVGRWRPNSAAPCRAVAAERGRVMSGGGDMYRRGFGKTHQIAYTYCSVGISDLKPLTGTSAEQLPHRKSKSLATA